MRDSLDVLWVGAAAIVPFALACAIASRLWRRRVRDDLGTFVGAGIVFACSLGFIAREFGHVLKVSGSCVSLQVACHFTPEPFTRYAIYAGMGMAQVFALFMIGLSVEERARRAKP